ncbi:AAA family ATPase [Conexibacter woesei]|uniref:AAA family ATPase n=1 Tax=Conexibacter woesei TaxID=191495 RepID=UPI000424C86F|nr:AAA family ATPase [Conexibacter woesei]
MIRIARLDLERWGHFDDRTLTFGPSGSLHLVYGPNEAGKSTTRRAVSALLFGVPARTRDTYGRPGADLRIRALLELGDRSLEVTRRKGIKNTLLDNNGDPLDETALRAALGGLTSEVHSGLFEITHESLVQGGEELLAGHGAVGESLFAAAAGTARLHRLLKHLESESETLFSTRPSKKELNLLLSRHAEVTRALRDASLRPPRYEALQRELSELTAALNSASSVLAASEHDHSRLERLRGALPLAAQRATRIAELAALGDVPALSADAADRRIAATNRRSTAAAAAAATTRELARARARTSELAVDDAFLPAAPALEALAATASSIESETVRRASLSTALTTLQASLADQLASLTPNLAASGAARLTLDADARDRLEAHLQARTGVQQAATSARAAVEDARRAAERAARDAAPAPAATDDTMLTAALRGARRAGDVDEEIARARADERAARAAADRTAGGDAEALAAIPVPDRETIERLLGDVVEAERIRTALETESDTIAETIRHLEAQRDDLGAEAPVLDASALDAARVAREATWSKVREALVSEAPVADVEQLAVEHELTTTEADDVADERLRHAEDVTRLADIERNLTKLARDTTDLTARRERHTAAIERATTAWISAWSAAGDAAPTPASAGTFLSRRETTLTHLRTATEAATRATTATHLRTDHTTSLRTALAATAPPTSDDAAPSAPRDAEPSADVPLATLIELAETRLESLRADADRATRAAEAVARTASGLEDAQADAARAEAALTAWTSEWTTLRDGCGLAENLAPDDALTTLRTLEQAARDQDRAASLTEELAALDAAREAFEADVATHVAQLTPDLTDRPALAAAQELHRRATAARAAAAERAALATAIADLERDEAEHQAVVAEADQELAALRATAGATDDAELIEHEQRAARAAALREEIASLDGDLARAGGQPADQVAAAVADLDADDAAVQADDLRSRIARERDARDEAAAAVTRAQDELARLERSDEAAALRQESATLEAEIRAVAERYARARLAQKVLRDAIASYRSAHEGPLLSRANELFPALTCERFARLETDVDDRDEDVLIAITADGSRRRVEELSDGTREQLFLALRLAAIERHVTTSEPVPVLFDDVLLESDDDRARRILTALASLAESTQVIVLTHHRHLISLAASTIPASSLDLITLAERQPIEAAAPSALPAIAAAEAEPEPIASEPEPAVFEPIASDAEHSNADDSGRTAEPEPEPVSSAPEDDDAPADHQPEDAPTPTLAEELAALTGPSIHESPYGEQTSLL